ncbi:hypothetical protein JCM11491_006730, partial [Sporobolomyces phaffii]
VPLEVGDEVYVVEVFRPRAATSPASTSGETDAAASWYRGYVVATPLHPRRPARDAAPRVVEHEPQVSFGVFPASHVHIREQLDDGDARIPPDLVAHQTDRPVDRETRPPRSRGPSKTASNGRMEPLHEEDEEEENEDEEDEEEEGTTSTAQRVTINIVPYSPSKSKNRASIGSVTSLGAPARFSSSSLRPPSEVLESRPDPPLPNLKCGDETTLGAQEPLVDEIACALREWASLLSSHLSRRDYALFRSTKERFDTLYSGRRRLLSKMLDRDEEAALKKELVDCLARGNIEQNLDIIVRHPATGVVVDSDAAEIARQSQWLSIVRLYATQVSLAYNLPTPPLNRSVIFSPSAKAVPGFAEPLEESSPFSAAAPSSPASRLQQVFVDFRGLAATVATPGETVELYLSLFNQSEAQFVTEDFCLVLDHNGVPARPESLSRMSTLFRDLGPHDVQDQLYLVCRIVKNGAAVKSSSGATASATRTPPMSHRSTFISSSPGPRSDSASIPETSSVYSLNGGNDVERIGTANEMLSTDASGRPTCRRPFGCAVLEISQFNRPRRKARSGTPVEHRMPIFVPTNEASFSTLHEHIIASRVQEFEKNPRADHVAVAVQILEGERGPELARALARPLSDVTSTHRLGFPDVVFPDVRRNEVFVKLWTGDFATGGGSSNGTTRSLAQLTAAASANAKNVEISVELRGRDGRPVECALSRGSGEANLTRFTSMVFRSNNTPTWGELVKVDLPLEDVENCHLYFTFRSRSITATTPNRNAEQPFAFAYFPLFAREGAFQPDGSHTLVLYRWDRSVSVPAFYLQGPAARPLDRALAPLPPAVTHTLVPLQDTFVLRSFLVSTLHTQNETLLRLLAWRTGSLQDPELAKETLSQLAFCAEVEICKFLGDIFDALFGLLCADTSLNEAVFQALVTILGFVSDRRFTNFKPVLERYISQHFGESTAGLHILRSLGRLLEKPGDIEKAPLVRSSIKVWKWLFEFVVRSHELDVENSIDTGSLLEAETASVLASLKALMRATTPSSIIGTQTLAVQHFAGILPSLAALFKAEDLVEEVVSFVDAIGSVKGKMVVWRLLLINRLVTTPVLSSPSSRAVLLPNVVRWIKPSLGKFDEQVQCRPNDPQATRDNARVSWIEGIRLSVGVVAVVLDKVHEALVDPAVAESRALLAQEHDTLEYLLGLLPRLFESYRELQNVAALDAVERQRSPASVPSMGPAVFPSTYPLALLSYSAAYVRSRAMGVDVSTMPAEVETWPTLEAGVGEIGAVFVALVLLSPRKIFVNWLESTLEIEGKDTFARQLGQLFRVARSIVGGDGDDGKAAAFPSTWLNMTALAHRAIMQVVEAVADLLEQHFLPPPPASSFSFNTALWKDYFALILKLVASPRLLIEEFSPQKRRSVWRLTGDIRAEGAKILSRLWNAIASPHDRKQPVRHGGFQVQFIPAFLGDVLTLCMSRHDELRKTAVEILYSMILGEYYLNSPPQFALIEKEVIDRFDRLFGVDAKGDELARASFVDQLRQLFDASEMDDDLNLQVDRFLASINSFLDLLLDVRALPEGQEYQEDRIISTLKLMSFIREIGRSEIYVRYVNRLVTYHIALGNETEAGLTLKLHADLHEWDLAKSVEAEPDLDLPRQTEFARKETLYMRILEHLGRGKAWESAIALSKELQHEYETRAFNYARLSELLGLQSELYAGIATSDREFGKYFRVAFYGQWPSSVSGKQFVYRGQPFETLGAFIDRMLDKHPNSQLLNVASIPDDDVRYGETQYLQITAILPEVDLLSPVFSNPNLPEYVRRYYQENDVNTFSFTSPLASASDSRDPSSSWTEKTVLICEESFPTILRRSEVVEIRLIEISPVENALQDVDATRRELEDLERRYAALSENEADPRAIDSNALAMALNDAVDPPSDRGIPHYRRVFLDPEFVATLPTAQLPMIRQVEAAIDDFVVTLARCLKLHATVCPREMQSFHETLERFFEKTFVEELARLPAETYEPASFDDFARSPPETSLDLVRDPSSGSNGLLISTNHRDSLASTLLDRPRLGSISGASLNGNGGGGRGYVPSDAVRTRTGSILSVRPPSPTKSLAASTSMIASGSGKENGAFAPLGTSTSSSVLSVHGASNDERSATPTSTNGGGKRTSIFGNFGKKKGLGKRKASVTVLAEE